MNGKLKAKHSWYALAWESLAGAKATAFILSAMALTACTDESAATPDTDESPAGGSAPQGTGGTAARTSAGGGIGGGGGSPDSLPNGSPGGVVGSGGATSNSTSSGTGLARCADIDFSPTCDGSPCECNPEVDTYVRCQGYIYDFVVVACACVAAGSGSIPVDYPSWNNCQL